jgi:hypothetical protein
MDLALPLARGEIKFQSPQETKKEFKSSIGNIFSAPEPPCIFTTENLKIT